MRECAGYEVIPTPPLYVRLVAICESVPGTSSCDEHGHTLNFVAICESVPGTRVQINHSPQDNMVAICESVPGTSCI